LLAREHRSTERLVNRDLHPARNAVRFCGTQHLNPHDIPLGVVQKQRDELAGDDRRQAAGEIAEKRAKVSVCGDGLRHFAKQLVAALDLERFVVIQD
jgi:hypothetical protein